MFPDKKKEKVIKYQNLINVIKSVNIFILTEFNWNSKNEQNFPFDQLLKEINENERNDAKSTSDNGQDNNSIKLIICILESLIFIINDSKEKSKYYSTLKTFKKDPKFK